MATLDPNAPQEVRTELATFKAQRGTDAVAIARYADSQNGGSQRAHRGLRFTKLNPPPQVAISPSAASDTFDQGFGF